MEGVAYTGQVRTFKQGVAYTGQVRTFKQRLKEGEGVIYMDIRGREAGQTCSSGIEPGFFFQ